ncbi:CoB--CoM heterodisulfide reductase iron-sulfur subunit A family protein [Dissulfurirhabdus thermomarina]|uniref:CoB--CoM heterodisulfide reductase iron-sulfur subunit A family protein n=1 Tax=Dissulfurirhabdus thermomarina TaxID=1765737 RepID=A0A6N9TMA1_DISTH|nr:FAD-dependent oxidoreductase [Dissulfurirhabdus thermomarina]NDY42249.1 CoB--CoM heterodisulfide reductase iron-sulfur subunit A family protein [Dissulfurirhabdus thermomarina]NMX22980.1 CoB--CoM heterodisulfide reductase iron-sulfur subunit A family protein [Dissulfurirhabdus thermomarina]
METTREATYDAVVVGGGIAGLQAALDLADQDFRVAVVERDASIGGKMIRLSKVFPTLDCASCITTPKMAAAAHHPNITLYTYCRLDALRREGTGLTAEITRLPRYVDPEKCIGCRKCEYACPVFVPDEEQGGFSLRKAIYIPFSNAIPQVALMDVEHCMLCGTCAKVCPTGAVDYFQQPERLVLRAGAAVLATGFRLTPADQKAEYGGGRLHNVVTSLQMERLLAPHGPYQRVLRPSDGKEPGAVAYVQCAGSRDHSLGVPYCSRVCCMYAIKQAMLLSGALPLADITLYYMDIRAFGKGYEQFYQNAKAMGIEFVKAKVARLEQADGQDVRVHYEDMEGEGGSVVREHDLVVLSLGMVPDWNPAGVCPVPTDSDAFLKAAAPKLAPARTEMEGVFMAGAAAGPKDIVDSIAEAGAAALEAAAHLRRLGKRAA